MKKITVFILFCFCFFASSAFSEMRKVAQNTVGSDYYVDFDSITKKSDYVYYWGLTNYKKAKSTGTKSIKYFKELDCVFIRYKFLTDHAFTGDMGTGEIKINNTPDKEWNYAAPGSVGYSVYKTVCDYIK